MCQGRYIPGLLLAMIAVAFPLTAPAIVVSTGSELIQAVANRAPLIEISGTIELSSGHQNTATALPVIEGFEVTLRGRPGAKLLATQPGFRLVEIWTGGRLNIESLTISGFSAPAGGAIWVEGGELRLERGELRNNQSILSGGAIQVRQPGARLHVLDSVFENNHAGRRGGAISLHGLDVPVVVERNRFVDNNATFGCVLSIVDTEQGRFSDNVFRGECDSALVDLDTSNIGPDLFNNTWLASGSMAFRFRPHGDAAVGRARMAGNVLVQNAIGPMLCQGTAPGDGIESLGENVATDASCDLDAPTDWIEPDPWQLLADPEHPDPAMDGPPGRSQGTARDRNPGRAVAMRYRRCQRPGPPAGRRWRRLAGLRSGCRGTAPRTFPVGRPQRRLLRAFPQRRRLFRGDPRWRGSLGDVLQLRPGRGRLSGH